MNKYYIYWQDCLSCDVTAALNGANGDVGQHNSFFFFFFCFSFFGKSNTTPYAAAFCFNSSSGATSFVAWRMTFYIPEFLHFFMSLLVLVLGMDLFNEYIGTLQKKRDVAEEKFSMVNLQLSV